MITITRLKQMALANLSLVFHHRTTPSHAPPTLTRPSTLNRQDTVASHSQLAKADKNSNTSANPSLALEKKTNSRRSMALVLLASSSPSPFQSQQLLVSATGCGRIGNTEALVRSDSASRAATMTKLHMSNIPSWSLVPSWQWP